jgi:hypothetical protein
MLEAASSILLGKKMRIIKLIFLLLILAIGYLPVVTHAQNNPNNPLVIFVNNTPGTTMLQRAVGYALIYARIWADRCNRQDHSETCSSAATK